MTYRVRLFPNDKRPAPDEHNHRLISDDPFVHEQWRRAPYNLGLLLAENHLVVLDFDIVEWARKFYREHRELCTHIVRTPRGAHFRFFGHTKTRKIIENGEEVGDIKGNGHVVEEGNRVRGKLYSLLRDGPLQPFPEHLFPIPETEVKTYAEIDEEDPVRRLMRARAWMKNREGGEDGNGRGLRMIKTCRALFAKFRLTEDQVWPLILEFNERACRPPYNEKQLRHKIVDSQKGLK